MMHTRGLARVGRTTLGRLVRRPGMRRSTAKTKLGVLWSKGDRNSRIAMIRRLGPAMLPGHSAVCRNELDMHRNVKIGANWTPPGIRRRTLRPIPYFESIVAGAMDATSGQLA